MILVLGQPIILRRIFLQERGFLEQSGVDFSNWVKFDRPQLASRNFLILAHYTLGSFSKDFNELVFFITHGLRVTFLIHLAVLFKLLYIKHFGNIYTSRFETIASERLFQRDIFKSAETNHSKG